MKRDQIIRFFGELPPALIGIEACGTEHYWAHQLAELGHEVKLIPPACLKSYVKRQ